MHINDKPVNLCYDIRLDVRMYMYDRTRQDAR